MNKKEKLKDALYEVIERLDSEGNYNIKAYEAGFQEAIEKIWPDMAWWDVVGHGCNIFGAMFFQDLTPEQTAEYILDHVKEDMKEYFVKYNLDEEIDNKQLDHLISYFDAWGKPDVDELQEVVDYYHLNRDTTRELLNHWDYDNEIDDLKFDGEKFYGLDRNSEEADDLLFALQVQYGRPHDGFEDFEEMNLSQDKLDKALKYVRDKELNKFTYFDESLKENAEGKRVKGKEYVIYRTDLEDEEKAPIVAIRKTRTEAESFCRFNKEYNELNYDEVPEGRFKVGDDFYGPFDGETWELKEDLDSKIKNKLISAIEVVMSNGRYNFSMNYLYDVIKARTGLILGSDYKKEDVKKIINDIRNCYKKDKDSDSPLDESLSLKEDTGIKWTAFLDSDRRNIIIVKAEYSNIPNFNPREHYWEEIEPIKPNKKTLLANDDESIDIIAENVTKEGWMEELRKDYRECKAYANKEGLGDIYSDLTGHYIDFNKCSEKDYVNQIFKFYDDSFWDRDSSSQYRWYSLDDAIDLDEYKETYFGAEVTDESLKESLEKVKTKKTDYTDMIRELADDEVEAVNGYDRAILMFNESDYNQFVVDELEHIKSEELEHIRELKELLINIGENKTNERRDQEDSNREERSIGSESSREESGSDSEEGSEESGSERESSEAGKSGSGESEQESELYSLEDDEIIQDDDNDLEESLDEELILKDKKDKR